MSSNSSITKKEKDSLKIEKFVFHIIKTGEKEPIYLDEISLPTELKKFFTKIIIDSASKTQFIFKKHELNDDNGIFLLLDKLKENQKTFFSISKEIAKKFNAFHKGNSNDGVFIISLISINNTSKSKFLLALIKMDDYQVIHYTLENNNAVTLKQLTNNFVEDKKAIQKIALIDLSDSYTWDVIGFDRNKNSLEGIAQYFKDFLYVERAQDEKTLTLNTIKFVKEWRQTTKINIPSNKDVLEFKNRAISYLENSVSFNINQFIEQVLPSFDDNDRNKAKEELYDFLLSNGIGDDDFMPDLSSITHANKNKIKTTENVTVSWNGCPEDRRIEIKKDPDNSIYTIIITSSKPFEEDF